MPAPGSELAAFLKSLVEEGRAPVSPLPLSESQTDAAEVLQQLDQHRRNELGLDAPAFSSEAALWAARVFYQLCQFVVCRELSADTIATALRTTCPAPRGPETDWSVDLVFCHLPRLFQLARQLSNADPLVEHMKQLAAAWPLSSVGITGLADLRIDSILRHSALRRLYADRIVAAGDDARLGDRGLDDQLRMDLGIHRDLAPALAGKLFTTPS
jgi:MoxR-vWA-beta-propeller ternary system protein